ncbi:D-alanine--D-alanine ligase [Saprospiraceae bacterium]|nr:D-alanine--D-alanine ligase [Saprospiraceae bacterium]
MKIGIFFGGPSREREISFAGGRTVFDNLNKSLFESVPVFVDSLQNFILLDWEYVYKGTIRDFYPPISTIPKSKHDFQIYIESLEKLDDAQLNEIISKVGRKIEPSEFHKHFDFAFLALHGYFGEDGLIQGILEREHIPYTGSGVKSSALGMDKSIQKTMMGLAGFEVPEMVAIKKRNWTKDSYENFYKEAQEKIAYPLVIRPANQGSSIGVSILMKDEGFEEFFAKVNLAFFRKSIVGNEWNTFDKESRIEEVRDLSDIRSGLGFPMKANGSLIYHPDVLLETLDLNSINGEDTKLESLSTEYTVVLESFIKGKEFSCIVTRKENGQVRALPPTEIVKQTELYDYKSKYLPGLSRKITPIDLPSEQIESILIECERLYSFLDFQTYARIDGFYGNDGKIYLNDPNTTSGMLPSSFFFHQAAEIGLNPSQFLTMIVRNSLQERLDSELYLSKAGQLLKGLDESVERLQREQSDKIKVAVIFGGYSFERHISVESGRNIYEKLSSSDKYEPIPVFLSGNDDSFDLYEIPIPLLLKDNADDIRDKINSFSTHPIVKDIRANFAEVTKKYVSHNAIHQPNKLTFEALAEKVDCVFIALHGRPGEDGTLQQELKKVGLAYNGSDWDSSHITIDKYNTLQTLKDHGFKVADQYILNKKDQSRGGEILKAKFEFPFILKPVDDGCSSAVKMIKDENQMNAYIQGIFREREELGADLRTVLDLGRNEEFPSKDRILGESLISAEGAYSFMEITGGLLTHVDDSGNIQYEMFEPSEALATGSVLSLEEKFLAGEGQNITPARFSNKKEDYEKIATQVKADLEKAARILKVKGYARIDAFVRIDEKNQAETIIIEVNSLPGMTPATCIFHQCAINGYKPYEFIDKILEFALDEQKATRS